MRQFSILILAIISAAFIANADITGKVFNEQREPIIGASLVLLELPDSTFVSGDVTLSDGSFTISGEKPSASYLLKVQSFGYEQSEIKIDAKKTLPLDIILKLTSRELSEVVVSGKAPVLNREGGKFIFIPNKLADAVTNARNLMNYVPLVQWGEQQASITGKGISKVYLNGRDPHWNHNEVSAMLRTLDPHYIKRVEIITDPGATQSASFSGGVINIIYDDPTQGFRGNAYVNASVSNDNPMVWPNLWLNYQKKRFKATLNLNYYYNHIYNHTTENYDYSALKRYVTNDSKNSSFNNMLQGKLNLSYDLTSRSVVGVSVSLSTLRSHSNLTVNTVTRDEAGDEEQSTMRQTQDSHPDEPAILAVAYYTLNLDEKGSMIDILAGYGTTASHTDIKNVFSGISMPQLFENEQYAFSGKADFTKVFNPTTRFIAGVEFLDLHLTDTQTFDNVFDKFKYYDRQIHAYLQFNRRWNNHISTNIGLRIENTHTQGDQLQDMQTDIQDYTDLFPSFAISWNIPKANQSLSLSYVRNIFRPSYQKLNPYKIWSSDNTYSQGNPYLRPSYMNRVYISYSLANKLVLSSTYTYDSPISLSYTTNTADGNTVTSFANTGRRYDIGIQADFNTNISNVWLLEANASVNYSNIKSKAEGNYIHSSGWNCLIFQDNKFILSRRHMLIGRLNQNVYTPHDYGFYKEDWRYNIIAGLSKSFDFGLEANLDVMIPITGYKNYRNFTTPDYSYNFYNHGHQYSVNLIITYSFGKKQVYGAKDRTSEIK